MRKRPPFFFPPAAAPIPPSQGWAHIRTIVVFPLPPSINNSLPKKARRDSPPDVPPVQLGEVDQVRPEPVHQGAEGQPVPPGGAHVLDVHPGVAGHLPGAPEEKMGGNNILINYLFNISYTAMHIMVAFCALFSLPSTYAKRKGFFCIFHVLQSVF